MSNMTIRVELMAGTSLENAVKEAKAKVEQWNVSYIVFNFNGVTINVHGLDYCINEVNTKYKEALSSKYKFIHV